MADTIAYLDGNRRLLIERLGRELPQAVVTVPEATYLAWIDVSNLTERTDLDVLIREDAGISVMNGAMCGEAGKGYFRLNFATPRPILNDMITRIITLFSAL